MNSLLSTGLQYLDRVTYKLKKPITYMRCVKNTDTAFVSLSKFVLILQYGIS